MKGATNIKLKAWRAARGLTMEEAAAMVVVDGVPCTKPTWHGWESAGKVPKRPWMIPLCDLTGLEPNDFYPPRNTISGPTAVTPSEAGGGGSNGGTPPKPGGGEPPQMAFAL